MSWPIETCFEEGKQELGLGDYQVRSWTGWHHHMTLCVLAQFFLVRLQIRFKDKAPNLTNVSSGRNLYQNMVFEPQDLISSVGLVCFLHKPSMAKLVATLS